jgi:hypothetical protein
VTLTIEVTILMFGRTGACHAAGPSVVRAPIGGGTSVAVASFGKA